MTNPGRYFDLTKEALDTVRLTSLLGLARSVYTAWDNDRTIFTCGNGGSAAND
jgi:phosphoheptose isomerase